MKLLESKVAIITGSTSGIGESAARAFAEHGARVLVTGRDEERGKELVLDIEHGGMEAMFVQADLADANSPKRIVESAVGRWGGIDVVINNAALICHKPNSEVTHADWDRLFAVNLKAAFYLAEAALPYLKKSRGVVVNVSSINGVLNNFDNLVYDTMKAALNHMTRGLALDNLRTGVRFNAVMPGGVQTPLLDQWLSDKHNDGEELRQVQEELAKSQQVAQPRQIADALVFLASGLASWTNGAIIPLEGGYSLGQLS